MSLNQEQPVVMSVIPASEAIEKTQKALQQNLWSVQDVLPACLDVIDDYIRDYCNKGLFTTGFLDGKWTFSTLIKSDNPLQCDHNDRLCDDLDGAIEDVLVHRGYRYKSKTTDAYDEWQFKISWSD